MTRKQRILATIRRKPVDCVPHATYNIFPFPGSRHLGDPSYAEILDRIRAGAGTALKVGCGCGEACIPADRLHAEVQGSGEDRIHTTTLSTPKGNLVSVSRTPENKPSMTIKHFLATDDDVEKYLSLPCVPPVPDLTNVRRVLEALGDRGVVFVPFAEPAYSVAALFDFEDFCIRCATDLATVKRLMDWSFERCIESVRRIVDACRGMDVILHTAGPEVFTPPMMPPGLFAELVTPYMRRIVEVIHAGGLPAAIHCHGRVREVLPQILETGADLLEPIEPPEQGNITLAELLDQCDGRMCVMGHVQDQEFYTAAPGHMTRWVERLAAVARGRTGYIMSPTCTPFQYPCSDVYKRNYLEWLEACERILAG